ncbi:hypothetical protein FGE12_20625 [Aggregicoccus sp. 17bor-14]|uniref:hypothetical protein n=1 Tax=Myxococcaceae TaxID=31 RepID=UPI00129C1290|nr:MULTISPECIES: hypothetical protein [Myxococcaceae]MBF5044816.1 hypothetical protein [Simulacricoccus sp. 17bor-14]MRI90560.1 hypothetical protein [Aggregicoccus sp. 17bor-14]
MHAPLRLAALLLLVSSSAFAQGMDPWAVDPVQPEQASAPALHRPSPPLPEPEAPPPERWSTGARLGAELGGGMAGTVLGGVVGGAGLSLLGLTCFGHGGFIGDSTCFWAVAGAGAILGGLVGMPLGIRWGGRRAGGNGSALAATVGIVGSLVAVGLVLASDHPERAGFVALSAPLLGVVGYELTARGPRSARLTPSLSLSPGGGALGLRARF